MGVPPPPGVYPVVDTFYGASIWLVTSVAIERYVNIVKRVEVYRNRSLKTTTLAIVAIWITSFSVVSLPLFFVIELEEKHLRALLTGLEHQAFFTGNRCIRSL